MTARRLTHYLSQGPPPRPRLDLATCSLSCLRSRPTVSFPIFPFMSQVLNMRPGKQLRSARAALSRAQRETQEAFKRYKSCLDVEAAAMQQVAAAEERRDALSEYNDSSNEC